MVTTCTVIARNQAIIAMPRYFLAFDLLSGLALNRLVFVIAFFSVGSHISFLVLIRFNDCLYNLVRNTKFKYTQSRPINGFIYLK